ncbi:response regulator transcription factor [Roseibium sp. MMSF_3544]|uniref:helix-turn-helix transcriptional regulator n=1 Tax=unclassified Roseibium TaxID=2629323 RepID=UPI00273ECFC2|nr:response regulator transcription factor [Roseibium sp. MMSF_3544]
MSSREFQNKGSIYYIGVSEKFPKELEDCVDRELDDAEFIRLGSKEDLTNAERKAEYSKRLFLIDEHFGAEQNEAIACLRRHYPEANFCILINDDLAFPKIIRDYFENGLIKSVLPMNLRVDLWLGAIRLMLSGGDYLPADVIKYMHSDKAAGTLAMTAKQFQPAQATKKFNKLTKRETQVLHLISEGHQNKNIAQQLSLSEHTIKLHIHHIISKLGVSNRTEAAAIYLQSDQSTPMLGM